MPMVDLNSLSNREQDVVKLLREGKSNKLIASDLSISERTVEFHLKNIFDKLHVNSRVELIIKLGESTVAAKEENAENRDTSSSSNWATSLKEAASKIGKELRVENIVSNTARSNTGPMSFFESIRTCLVKYADFNGRASRSEFWWFALFILLAATGLTYLSNPLGEAFLVAVVLPLLAAGARRLHDTGRSGWWQLFILAPFAGIVLVGILWAVPPVAPQPEDMPPV